MARDPSSFTGSQPKTDYTKVDIIRSDPEYIWLMRFFVISEGGNMKWCDRLSGLIQISNIAPSILSKN